MDTFFDIPHFSKMPQGFMENNGNMFLFISRIDLQLLSGSFRFLFFVDAVFYK